MARPKKETAVATKATDKKEKANEPYTKENFYIAETNREVNIIKTNINSYIKKMEDIPSMITGIVIMSLISTIASCSLLAKLWDYKDNYSNMRGYLISTYNNVDIAIEGIEKTNNILRDMNRDMATIKNIIYSYDNGLINCQEINDGKQVICDARSSVECYTDKFYNLNCDK